MSFPNEIPHGDSALPVERPPGSLPDIEQFLRMSPWAGGLSESSLAMLQTATCVRTLEPGQVLCRQGDRPSHWFGIMQGLLRMDMLCADGNATSVTAAPVGTWFGEASLVIEQDWSYEISALRHARIACIGRDTFRKLFRENEAFNDVVSRMLARRLLLFIDMFADQRRADIDRRVARILVSLVPRASAGPAATIDITHDELATLAGVSRQRAGRALQALQAQGLLETAYSRVTIFDRGELQSAC